MAEQDIDLLLKSKDIEEIRLQLDKYQSIIDLARNPILNDKSKRAVLHQAYNEYDKVIDITSILYSKLGTALLSSKETKRKDASSDDGDLDHHVPKPKPEAKRLGTKKI